MSVLLNDDAASEFEQFKREGVDVLPLARGR